jgi:hypothetical protein
MLKGLSSATTLSELSAACNLAARQLAPALNKVKQATAKSLLLELIYTTPVDTSQARSNWLVGKGTPSYTFIPAHVAGFAGSTAGQSSAIAYANGVSIINTVKPRETIYLTNSAPYIEELNADKSSQVEAGYVEKIINKHAAEAPEQLRRAIYGD